MIRQRTKFDLSSGGELWIVVTATDAGQSRGFVAEDGIFNVSEARPYSLEKTKRRL